MAVLQLVTGIDSKILRAKSLEVKKIDKKVKKLIADMIDTVIDCDGLGIAAPQVGANVRIYIARLNFNTPSEMWVPMINVKFLSVGEETSEHEEGCLSIPGKFGVIRRATEVTIEYSDLKGQRRTLHLEGLNARIMQHETDHLDGVLIADKMVREVENTTQKK